jgi:hypothetical protein
VRFWYWPPAQSVQLGDAVAGWERPTGHALQLPAPEPAYSPASHGPQVADSVALVRPEKWPAGHGVHAAAAFVGWNSPAAHRAQLGEPGAAAKAPAGHTRHVETPAGEYAPAEQAAQPAAPECGW